MTLKDSQAITEPEKELIAALIRRYPLTTFQTLNLYLNKTGLCISITHLSEWDEAYRPGESTGG